MDESLDIALEDVAAQRVERHRMLKPLSLIHRIERRLRGPSNVLASLLFTHHLRLRQQVNGLIIGAAKNPHFQNLFMIKFKILSN